MSDSNLDSKYEVFRNLLETCTPADAVKQLQVLGLPGEEIQRIRDHHEKHLLEIRELEEPRAVVQGNRDTWYTGPRDSDIAWPAVRRIQEEKGLPKEAVTALDEDSTRIVSLLNHPREPEFHTRGLVVGYVQSGKTTNFTSVIAKAADRGYKLFIVLAGIHNGLRKQTQARLVQQLVAPNRANWSQLTGLEQDFVPPENAQSYFGGSNRTHVICVVKKNAPVLRKFVKWLHSASDYLQNAPALIIDDEADQATPATKSINPLIREILGALPKSAYVGYTASPFANVLINPAADDLYPKDFIVNLRKPAGYFGTEVLFGRYALDDEDPSDLDDGYDMLRNIPDDDVHDVRPASRAEVEGFTPTITDSLRDAVHYFWLSTAARRVRGNRGNPHATMLVHTSVNTLVHESFRKPLEKLHADMRDRLNDPATVDRLRVLWQDETKRVPATEFGESAVPFEELWAEIPGVLDDCRIIMDNSNSEDRLDYDNGPVVAIAVGGNTLSRGLTLEGLSVSYFVRAVSAYDTLLQMGRWFGFRHGYADLPRIWMTEELQRWFRHLATVETEMRRDIDIYMSEDETPLTFAVRLRTHPALRVTAAAKMKDAVATSSSYGGRRIQTRYFHTNGEWLRENQRAARTLVAHADKEAKRCDLAPERGRHIFRDVSYEHVLEFLRSYAFHPESQDCDSDSITSYINKRVGIGSLRQWNVAIVGNAASHTEEDFEFVPGVRVGGVTRARLKLQAPKSDYADIKTLMSRADAAVDLEDVGTGLTEGQIKKERRRLLPHTGLLVLYPIDKGSSPAEHRKQRREPLGAEEDVLGVGLVFPEPPRTRDDSTVKWNGSHVSADLSRVQPEEVDYSPVESEDMA